MNAVGPLNIRGTLLCVLLMILSVIGYKRYQHQGRAKRLFLLYCIIFSVLLICLSIYSGIRKTYGIVGAYQKGNYSVVEGYVENFHPMPGEGHRHESFEISGISFHYSDYEALPSYHTTSSHGGVIKGNGQRLIIKYVTYGNRNYICSIEEADR